MVRALNNLYGEFKGYFNPRAIPVREPRQLLFDNEETGVARGYIPQDELRYVGTHRKNYKYLYSGPTNAPFDSSTTNFIDTPSAYANYSEPGYLEHYQDMPDNYTEVFTSPGGLANADPISDAYGK